MDTGSDLGIRPTLSQFRKSWGFRRTTIAKREFIEEVGELAHSPPLVRRGRSRRINQTPQTPTDTESTQKPLTARSVLDDLQWSAPSSPLSDDGKLSSETSAGDALDPLLWQDFGSAFHTAFSLLETPKQNDPDIPAEKEASTVNVPLDPAQQLSPDCVVLDRSTSQSAAAILGQFDDVLEEIEGKKKAESLNTCPSISDTEGCDPNALCCIYHQKHDQRFMVCCHSCQAWFHDSCADDSSTEVWKTERKEHRNTCPQCATKTQLVFESPSQPEADLSLPESWRQSPTGDDSSVSGFKGRICLQEHEAGKVEVQPNSLMKKHEVEMETDHSHPVCTGPGCSRQALPDSVYCGTDCILQHAAITMKTLSDPKVPKTKGRGSRKSAGDKPTAKADKNPVTYCEAGSSPKHLPDDTSRNPAVISQSAMEEAAAQSQTPEKPKDPESSSACPEGSVTSTTPSSEKSGQALISKPPTSSASRHHESGALKPSASQSVSRHISASAAVKKPSSALGLSSETRILPVSPAPSAPSSRPCQPNNQIRQSIQRSLTSILLKRICDCEDLEMSESEVAKLVASIETEMFDIFRNTDSKYMNKYRTIMFNLKDPKNKGLLYRVVHGEIGPFRLVRMSQKDMQAITAPEPKAAEKSQKKNLAPPSSKARASHPGQDGATPDILSCMLKDTTSEHKAHLFDLKCKICTGQKQGTEAEEPVKKKPKLSLGKDKNEPPWKKSVEESSLRAPPDFVDKDSPASSSIDSFSHLSDSPKLTIVESPASPTDSHASPTFESPASPVIESPASPTPDSSSVTPPKRGYTPVVIPAVSTVSILRRDPRTAASRMASSSGNNNTIQNQAPSYAPVKDTPRSSSAPSSSLPAPKTLPKSILLKPSSTADPRLYGSSSRYVNTMASKAPAEGDTAQFLAKQDILWKGFLNMLTVAKFVTKGYLVSGSDLPDTIQIGGRILPETVWDYVEKLKTSITKELCVIRFQPATEEEEVAYVSLFSYFSSRGRFGVVANISRSIKDVYLVPLSAKESIPSMLQPLQGPGVNAWRQRFICGRS
uniref:Death-inducer obliterator 1 n=1 Tax=Oryzias latipes TaxID=8090 RepID=A0A3P9L8A5_ORYLA